MSTLTGRLINNTYKQLLKVATSANTGITGTLTTIQDGDAGNTALQLATSAAQIDGTLFVGQTFGVSGDASVAGGLAIANKVCASAYYGDGSNLTGLTFSGDVSVSSLIVTNNATIGGNVTIGGNIMVSGGEIQVKNGGTQSNIKLYCESGNAHYAALQAPPHSSFSGNITITLPTSAATLVGTSTTDTLLNKTFGDKVDFNDDVCISGDSVLVGNATIGGTLSVGGAVNLLSTATVSGTAGFLGAIRVSGNASVGGTLDVGGNVSIGGNVTVKGDVHVSSKVCASAFYGDGTNITGIPITGNISVSNAKVGGTLSVSGATHLKSTVSIAGAVNLASTLTVASNASVGGTLSVGGAVNLLSTATVSGATGFLTTVRVSGNTSIGGTLDVAGNVSLGGNVTVKGDVHVSSKVCASAFFGDGANLTNVPAVITGNISVNNVTIGGTLHVGGITTVVGYTHFKDDVSVSGNVHIGGTTTIGGAVSLGSTLDINGNTSVGGTLITTGKAEFEGDVSVSGDINVGGHVTIAGAVQLGSTLSVTGYSHFKDDVSVSGNAIIGGTVSVGGGIIDLKNGGSQSELRMYCESGNAHYAALKAPPHSAFSGNIALVMPATADTLAGIAATQTFTNKTFGDKVEFDNDVCISGNAFIGGTATIAGNASVGGTLTVGGKAEFDGDVCISGNSQLVGTLKVTGATTITGNTGFLGTVRVSGATSLEGAVIIDDTLTVTGATHLQSTASINSTLKVGGTTTITGNSGFLGTVRVSGNTSLEGQLQLTKSAAAVVCATAINGVTSVSLNFGNAQNFSTTVTAAHTLAKPTGCRTGQTGSIFLTQSGGSGTMAYNADFKFIGGTDPTLSTADGAVDRLDYIIVSASSDGVGGDIQMVISQAYA